MRIKIKNTVSVFLSLVMILMCCHNMTIVSAQSEWAAEGYFGKALTLNGMTAGSTVFATSGKTSDIGGKGSWYIDKSWGYNTMYIDVSQGRVKTAKGNNIYVEVEYYDNATDGWFYLKYNSRYENEKETPIEYLTGSNKWKKAGFVLEAPTMADDLNTADFGISVINTIDYSHSPIYIHSVKVKELDETSIGTVNMRFAPDGHNYFDTDGEIKIDIDVSNQLNIETDADLKMSVYDEYGRLVHEQTERVSLKRRKTVSKEVILDFKRFGVFTVVAEVSNKELKFRSGDVDKFAFVRESKFLSDKFGACNHFAWNQPSRDPAIIFPLMKKAGIGWTRDEILWKDYETQRGVYELKPHHERFLTLSADNGIKTLLILCFGNEIYTKTNNTVPITDEELDAFGKFCYNLVKDTKGRVFAFEYWNEFDHHTVGVDYKYYAPLAKTTYENLKKANPDARAVGITAAGTGLSLIKTAFDMGANEHMEDVSYHVYPAGSPEKAKVGDDSRSIRELINKYPGGINMKIWLTEMGWSSATYGKNVAAKYLCKEFVIQMEAELVERMFWYDMIDDQEDVTYTEATFGMLERFHPKNKNRFLAKPAYVATAAMNGILGTPVFHSKMMLDNDTTYAYRYTREQDGMDTAVLWNSDHKVLKSFNFGSDDVKFYDMYGNPLDIKGNNGNYSILLDDAPVYAEGRFERFEEGVQEIYLSATSVGAAYEDEIEINIYKTTEDNVKIELDIDENSDVMLLNEPVFVGDVAKIILDVKGIPGSVDKIPLKITGDSGVKYYDNTIDIKYVEALEIAGRSSLYEDTNIHRWRMELDVKSNFHTSDMKAVIDVKEPKQLRGRYNAGIVKQGETSKLSFHIPEIQRFTSYKLKADIKLSNGYIQEFEMPIDFALAFYAENKPVIDGVLDKGEWKEEGKIVSNREDQVYMLAKNETWKSDNDLSAETYIMWDEENLYIACEVTDNIFSCNYKGTSIWQGDSLQFGLAYARENEDGETTTAFTEVGTALTPNGVELVKYSNESGTTMDVKESVSIVKRNGNKTIYEVCMPWSEAVPQGAQIKPNIEIGYSMLVNDNDTTGRRGWIEFGSGIGVYKAVNEFARIRLVPKR